MPRRAYVDPDVCIGSGNCVNFAPEDFQLGPDGTARVKPGRGELSPDVESAAEQCPIGAIALEETDVEGQ